MTRDIRWKQRFQNFERAFMLLRSVFDARSVSSLSDLEKEGTIQRFEYTYELAWKTLKDYLEYQGTVLDQITPRTVLKAAFAARFIQDGQVWMDMIDHRNTMAHMYSHDKFIEILNTIETRYLAAMDDLYLFLKEKSLEVET